MRRRVEEILSLVDRTQRELIEQDELVEGRVVIGGGELAAMQELPEMIASFRESQVLFTSNLSTNGALMVQKGLAYSLVIEGSVPFWDKGEITFRPLSPQLTANSALAWKKQQPFSLAATKFIEHMKCLLSIMKA